MVKDVAEVGCGRFPNGALGNANNCFAGVAEFWVIVFGVIRSSSASAIDGVNVAENVGGIEVTSRG